MMGLGTVVEQFRAGEPIRTGDALMKKRTRVYRLPWGGKALLFGFALSDARRGQMVTVMTQGGSWVTVEMKHD